MSCFYLFILFLVHHFLSLESLSSEASVVASSLPSASSAAAMVSTPSLSKLLSGLVAPANSESLDPSFLHLWPHPQQITQYKGTRLFPSSSLSVMLFRQPQTTGGDILFSCFLAWNSLWSLIVQTPCLYSLVDSLFYYISKVLCVLWFSGPLNFVVCFPSHFNFQEIKLY